MDITIQMRSLELLIKMLKRDMDGIPAYGYARQMGSLPLLSARESEARRWGTKYNVTIWYK